MVVFICNSCGDSLKKNVVAKHGFRCRTSQGVSCIDCNKTFGGDDYALHTACKTENEKYGGTGYAQKEFKGKKKQMEWNENISNFITTNNNIDPTLRAILEKIVAHQNIPKREKPFKNLLANSFKLHNSMVNQIWGIMEGILAENKKNEVENKTLQIANGQHEKLGSTDKKSKKRKNEGENSDDGEKVSKKVKKKKRKSCDDEEKEEEKEKVQNSPAEISSPKKKKKKNKNNIDETAQTKTLQNGNEKDENEVSTSKKKKKSKNECVGTKEEKTPKRKKTSVEEQKENTPQKKKNKDEEPSVNGGTPNGTTHSPSSDFKWKASIKKALKKTPEGKMKIKKLEKAILNEYFAAADVSTEEEEAVKEIFKMKIENDKFIIEDKYVKIKP